LTVLGACLFCLQVVEARGGGGPENVFLVVNSNSWASRTIANHYAAWRRIPASHIFLLKWDDGFATVGVEQFRQGILQPVLKAISARRLGEQIDTIVYSSDLPYAVNLAGDFPGDNLRARGQQLGSINGMTYLADLVMARNTEYVKPTANHYFQLAGVNTRAFRHALGWGAGGLPSPNTGRRYYLSTMLAVTSGRGNSLDEALRYLRRSVLADGTHPPGTIYFVRNGDIRSATRHRHNAFDNAVNQLRRLGVRAETVEGVMPTRKRDVQGAMMGKSNLRWPQSASRIMPGAICEHLTSYGGRMVDSSQSEGQTRLSELLRYGAAAASGTVSEPYARQSKFPTPMIHVHYARGSTVAEAFYQSVAGPFQLLIVGDPLCRPWATIPLVSVDGLEANATVSGLLELQPKAKMAQGKQVDHFELFVDGRRLGRSRLGETLRLDTTVLADGHHQLRVVAVEASPIRSQGRAIVPLVVNNHDRTCRLTSTSMSKSGNKIRWGQPLRLRVFSPGSSQILIYHNRELVGRIKGASGQVTVDARPLGYGPIQLVALGLGAGGRRPFALSAPLNIEVLPSRPMPAIAPPEGVVLVPGLQLQLADKTRVAISGTSSNNWLRSAGVKQGESFVLSAYFDVASEGVYQIQARQNGDLKVAIDGRVVFSTAPEKHGEKDARAFAQRYIPFSLAAGMHRVDIEGRPLRGMQSQLRFGGFASDRDVYGKGSQALSSKAGFRRPK
jgi:uncharacterized protein (TIGR03790 family)